MRTIIAGSRDILYYGAVEQAIKESGFEISEILCGMANGVDSLGRLYAKINNIPIKEFPADWSNYGKAAGVFRNNDMAEYADALILVWDGTSTGSADMLERAELNNLKIFSKIFV